MTYVFAATYDRAFLWAVEAGVKRSEWRYVTSGLMLRGLRGAVRVRMLDGWWDGYSKADIVDIFQQLWMIRTLDDV